MVKLPSFSRLFMDSARVIPTIHLPFFFLFPRLILFASLSFAATANAFEHGHRRRGRFFGVSSLSSPPSHCQNSDLLLLLSRCDVADDTTAHTVHSERQNDFFNSTCRRRFATQQDGGTSCSAFFPETRRTCQECRHERILTRGVSSVVHSFLS
jgi:hypothetical protein